MATEVPLQTSLPSDWSIADVLGHIDVPPERIRNYPAPGTATETDVQAIADREGRHFELIDGILVEKAMGFYEAEIAGLILYFIHAHLATHKLGHAYGADAAVQILTDQIRIPDVSFVSHQRRGRGKLAPIPRLVPNLAVEVLSKGNTPREMERKLREYFEAGVELVWYVDAKFRTARVYTSPTAVAEILESGVLDGGLVLPGLQISLIDLFARADEEGPAE